jgi:hypothetical protein
MDATVNVPAIEGFKRVLRDEKGRLLPGSATLNPNGTGFGTKKLGQRIKAQYLDAFNRLGGIDAFVEWGMKHKSEFYRMVGALLPKEFEVESNGTTDINVNITDSERNTQRAILERLREYLPN